MKFFEENWLWRGTQSAIFYYVSCSPWIEFKYKRKRRNEANRAQKQREDIITSQPGHVRQPGAFQTNSDWTEEILMGPGPPKGWKRDPVVDKVAAGCDKPNPLRPSNSSDETRERNAPLDEHDLANVGRPRRHTATSNTAQENAHASHQQGNSSSQDDPSMSTSGARRHSHVSTISTSSSTTSSATSDGHQNRPRPSLERRLSTAMDNIRVTLKSSMRPENWNWIRYEREDEILSGINQRMTEMWNRATSFGMLDKNYSTSDDGDDSDSSSPRTRRKRARTMDSDRFDYEKYTRNPEVNELHPPVVSRLPQNRDDAAWMILPPPSAAVMGGKARPQDESPMRWPLSRIGRTAEDWKMLAQTPSTEKSRVGSGQPDSIPELSDSFTEASSSDEETWQSDVGQRMEPRTEPNEPAQLDLIYLKGRRINENRSSWPIR